MGTKKNDKPAGGKAKPAKAEHDSKPQPWWFNQPNPIDRFTGWLVAWTSFLVLATVGLGIVALLQWKELRKTDKTLKETLEVSQRAWIAPLRPILSKPFAYQAPFEIALAYKNTGQQPAENTRSEFDLKVTAGNPLLPPSNLGEDNETFCKSAAVKTDGSLTFPNNQSYKLGRGVTISHPMGDVLDGKSIMHLDGCFVYETMGSIHKSRFCFYWQPAEGKNPQEWEWGYCPGGNDGD